jgi:hypothetical protein
MTRNQKIALGCGGAGCLGLLVVLVAGIALYFLLPSRSGLYNYNVSANRNSNRDSDSDLNANKNSNSNSDGNSNSSSSSLSEDDRHRLYHAAFVSGDVELLRRVQVKLGLMDEDFTPGTNYLEFVQEHVSWAARNGDFVQSVNTKEKALAYVNEHFPD